MDLMIKHSGILVITGIILLVMASCLKEPQFTLDFSGEPSLDTVTVDLQYHDTVHITCGQTLILDAGKLFNWFGANEYFWPITGDTTKTISVIDFPNDTFVIYKAYIMYSGMIDINDTTIYGSDTIVRSVIIHGNYVPFYVIPDAFTPNGDGWQDEFKITAICFSGSHIKVYSPFTNTLIYESSDATIGWDGYHKGKPMPVGEYRYELGIFSHDGQERRNHGFFQLIR